MIRTSKITLAIVGLGSFIAGGLLFVQIANHLDSAEAALDNSTTTSAQEKQVLYWYDPMKPDVKFDKPGKSPFMDMDLVPKYAGQDDGMEGNGVRIDPSQVQNLGLKTHKVELGSIEISRNYPANAAYNDYQFAIVQSRADGFVNKLYPLTAGDFVAKGSPLIDITVPQWVEAQSEYLTLAISGASAAQKRGASERLRLSGMPDEYIKKLMQTGKVQTLFTIKAPISGVITAFDIRSGMNISKDMTIAKIQGIDPLWINASIPESVAATINPDSSFELSIPALSGKTFNVAKSTILPAVDMNTRTMQLRLEVDNRDNAIKPGMSAFVKVSTKSPDLLLVPSSAVIDTGTEQRVIKVKSDGRFTPVKVEILQSSHHLSGIRQANLASGAHSMSESLAAGDDIVVNGLFLIDSEANISGALERMRQDAMHDHHMMHGMSHDMASHDMGEHNMSGHKMSGHNMSHDMSGHDMREHDMSRHKMSGHNVSGHNMSHDMSGHDMGSHDMNNNGSADTSAAMGSQAMSGHDMQHGHDAHSGQGR